MEAGVGRVRDGNQRRMTMNKPGHPPAAKPRLFCGSCSYPMDGDICPECGGRASESAHFSKASRSVGWICALLTFAWCIDLATVVSLNLLQPNMVSPSHMAMLMMLSRLPHALGIMLMTIVCWILLKGGWRLSAWGKGLLYSLLLVFPLIAALGLLILMFEVFRSSTDLGLWHIDLSLWMVLISSLEAIGMVCLVAAIGACSRGNPGGTNRWFLSRCWIALGTIVALQIMLDILFRWIAMSNGPVSTLQVIQGLSNMIVLIAIGSFVFKITFVGFLIPWKRTLTRCAEAHGPIST